jgi:hypothetical protein
MSRLLSAVPGTSCMLPSRGWKKWVFYLETYSRERVAVMNNILVMVTVYDTFGLASVATKR